MVFGVLWSSVGCLVIVPVMILSGCEFFVSALQVFGEWSSFGGGCGVFSTIDCVLFGFSGADVEVQIFSFLPGIGIQLPF